MKETLVPSDPRISDEVMEEAEHKASPEHQNPKEHSVTDSESSSDESSDDDEAQETLEIETLETELSSNPSNYDVHVQYIRALRKKGDIEKLRKGREAMSELFPLSPTMWQEWAKDETSLSSGPDSFSAIEKLYERGVFDYLSVPLWCDYLNFVQEHDPSVRECSPEGISKARNLFERALTGAGMLVIEGSKIWEAYREFELAILLTIDEPDVEAREKQVQRIRNIFHRQLSVPHNNLESTLLAYKMWEAEQGNVANSNDLDGISPHVATAYQKALDMLSARAHFEEQICRQDVADMDKLQEYMAYIKFEQSSGDPARVQILYERAVSEFPIANDLWLDYTRYLDKTLKGACIVRDVYSRATKNCPWVGELWVRYMLSLERGHASEKERAEVFEKSLLCTFSSFDEYLDIFLTRVDGLRRQISQADVGDGLDYALIRETFQRASDYLSPHFKGTDGLLRMYSYWARLESKMGKDLLAARGVWESLLKFSGSMMEAWQGYIAMEIEMGNTKEARSLYRRCYSKRFSGTGSEDICHLWLRFEREFGSLENFDHALQKVTPRLEELQLFRLQLESRNAGPVNNQKEDSSTKIAREKRKQGAITADEQPRAKRQKDATTNPKKARGEDKTRDKKSLETRKIEDLQERDVTSGGVHGKGKKDVTPGKPKYKDQCTAFLSNLSLEATEENLHSFLNDGGVVAIRILKDRNTGKSRGLAYVDFSDDAHLTAAVGKNKQMLLGKRVSIARSDPKQRRKNEFVGRGIPTWHGKASGNENGQTSTVGKSNSSDAPKTGSGPQPGSTDSRGEDRNVQLKGKNTFAVPRTVSVRPLGWTDKNKSKTEGDQGEEDQNPKSNDEFRKMFLKS